MEGGDTGVHEARRRACAAASYWLSGMSVAVGAPSYSGDPDEEEACPGWVRGAACAGEPRKNCAPSPLAIAAVGAPGVMAPLLTDHRLGYWLKGKRRRSGHRRRGERLQTAHGDPDPETPLPRLAPWTGPSPQAVCSAGCAEPLSPPAARNRNSGRDRPQSLQSARAQAGRLGLGIRHPERSRGTCPGCVHWPRRAAGALAVDTAPSRTVRYEKCPTLAPSPAPPGALAGPRDTAQGEQPGARPGRRSQRGPSRALWGPLGCGQFPACFPTRGGSRWTRYEVPPSSCTDLNHIRLC